MGNKPVIALFDKVAPRYDFMNGLLTWNLDHVWRRQAARRIPLPEKARILDLCTGTGDLAVALARRKETAEVLGLDSSAAMLSLAQEKVQKLGLQQKIRLQEADVFDLPPGLGLFDAVSVGFGLRNLGDFQKGIDVMAGMLKPDGHLLILEFSSLALQRKYSPYYFYLQNVIPFLGKHLTGAPEAYRYLPESIQKFPAPETIAAMLIRSGLKKPRVSPLMFGSVSFYLAQR